jgi:hypothetical protein
LKVLVYSVCMWPSHFETDLELAQRYADDGHRVYFLRCTGQLPVCTHNSNCPNGGCLVCTSRFDRGIRLIQPPPVQVISLRPPPDTPKFPYFDSIEELMRFKLNGISLGMAAASSLISRLNRDHKLDTKKYRSEVNRELLASYVAMINAEEVLQRIRPDKVVAFNGRFASIRPVIEVCKKYAINYELHERGASYEKFIISDNESVHSIRAATKEIKSFWQEPFSEKADLAQKWYRDRRQGKAQQWFSFVDKQDAGRLPIGFDFSKRNILICNTTIEEYCAIEEWERSRIGDDHKVLEDLLYNFLPRENFRFYLRCHPNLRDLDNSQMRELHALACRFKNLVFIPPESPISTYSLLDACEKTITFGSTIGVEAVVYNKPSILVGPALYRDLDVAHCPESLDELVALIEKKDLNPKPILGALQYAYWEATKGIPFKYYRASSLSEGTFKGHILRAGPVPRLFNQGYRIYQKARKALSSSLVKRHPK